MASDGESDAGRDSDGRDSDGHDSDGSDFAGSDGELAEIDAGPSAGVDLRTMRCPVCLEEPEIVAVVECGHFYCHECVLTALSSGRRANKQFGQCAICRERTRYSNTIYMEFKKGKARTAREPSDEAKIDAEIDKAIDEVIR